MFGRLLLVFILVPLADLVLLMVLNKWMGFWLTITLVILSGLLGAWLVKRQSESVKSKIKEKLSAKQLPGGGLMTDGAMIMFGAGLLITPGILTDLFGLTLMIPGCRNWYKRRVKNYLKENFRVQIVPVGPVEDPNVVDGEVLSGDSKPGAAPKADTSNHSDADPILPMSSPDDPGMIDGKVL